MPNSNHTDILKRVAILLIMHGNKIIAHSEPVIEKSIRIPTLRVGEFYGVIRLEAGFFQQNLLYTNMSFKTRTEAIAEAQSLINNAANVSVSAFEVEEYKRNNDVNFGYEK
jgi:hypothetical protein